MTFLTDGRPAFITTAAMTAYDAVTVVLWALLFCLAARRSRGGLARDLFGVVLAVAALSGS
jgi:hypothetical protein